MLTFLPIAPEPAFDPTQRAVLRDAVIAAARRWKEARGAAEYTRLDARLNLIDALVALDAATGSGP